MGWSPYLRYILKVRYLFYYCENSCSALTAIIDCAIGAWLGHDGFQWPGSGDYFHMLHHKHFDCNYGALHIPLDWLFGTYAGSKEDVKKIWGRTPSGEEANDTKVHPASISKYAVS